MKIFTELEQFKAAQGEIKAEDVVQAYLKEFAPGLHADHLPSIKDRVEQGIALIASAKHDYNKLAFEYRHLPKELADITEGRTSFQGPFSENFSSLTNFQLEKLPQILSEVTASKFPPSVEYIAEPFGTIKA